MSISQQELTKLLTDVIFKSPDIEEEHLEVLEILKLFDSCHIDQIYVFLKHMLVIY